MTLTWGPALDAELSYRREQVAGAVSAHARWWRGPLRPGRRRYAPRRYGQLRHRARPA